MTKHITIEYGPEEKIGRHPTELTRILTAIGKVMKNKHVVDAFVSDDSTIGDFFLIVQDGRIVGYDDDDIEELSQEVGIAVGAKDYLWQVAERLATGKS